MNEVTRILNAAGQSDARAANELLSHVYEELRRLAAAKLASEAPGQTLQATALVHEAWLRLTSDEKQKWNDRAIAQVLSQCRSFFFPNLAYRSKRTRDLP